jgi:hypothetical protein
VTEVGRNFWTFDFFKMIVPLEANLPSVVPLCIWRSATFVSALIKHEDENFSVFPQHDQWLQVIILSRVSK